MPQFTGRYSDGRSAAVHPVTVDFGPTGLMISPAGGTEPALGMATTTWSYGRLTLIEANRKRGPVRLTVADDEDARLTIDSDTAAFLDRLKAATPRVKKRHPLGAGIAVSFGMLAVGAALLYATLNWMPPVAAQIIPASWERSLGRQTVDGLETLFAGDSDEPIFCTGEAGQRALDRLAATLAAADGSTVRYDVRVMNSDIINAFAASGGYVIFFRGLIDAAESPDEVAAVLAHEIAHVEEHHVTEAMVRALGTQIIVNALFGGGGETIAGVGESLITSGYSRDAEREADARGLGMLRGAGLHTQGMVRFFERIREIYGDTPAILGILSTHPSTEERIQASRADTDAGRTALSDSDWAAVKAICGE